MKRLTRPEDFFVGQRIQTERNCPVKGTVTQIVVYIHYDDLESPIPYNLPVEGWDGLIYAVDINQERP